jgi:hypothetical protein
LFKGYPVLVDQSLLTIYCCEYQIALLFFMNFVSCVNIYKPESFSKNGSWDSQLEIVTNSSISPNYSQNNSWEAVQKSQISSSSPNSEEYLSIAGDILAHYYKNCLNVLNIKSKLKLYQKLIEGNVKAAIKVVSFYMPTNQSLVKHLILVGVENTLLIYDLEGKIILSQSFHNSNILAIKTKTVVGPKSSTEMDELAILYQGNILIQIDLSLLWMILKMENTKSQFSMEHPPLIFKKYKLKSTQMIKNFETIGYLKPYFISPRFDTFTHNFKQEFSSMIYLCIPYKAEESFAMLFKQEDRYSMPKQVAKKVTQVSSAVLSFAKSIWKEPELKTEEEITKLYNVFELQDQNRLVLDIKLSPTDFHKNYSLYCLMSDCLGRILLYETTTGMISYIWKGLRGADLCWIEGDGSLLVAALYKNSLDLYAVPTCEKIFSLEVEVGTRFVLC